jgi:hypothetical protein
MDILKLLTREEVKLTRRQAELGTQLKKISAAIEALSSRRKIGTHRVVSIEGRRRMSLAQRRRWAKLREKKAA